MDIRFADCRIDLDARRLLRGAREVHLSPKAFELLKCLIESCPRALSKTELLERIWPGVFVTDASLAKVVSEIRDAIGDRASDARIVRTVHRYGYAFAAEVKDDQRRQAAAAPAGRVSCWLFSGSREFPLHDGKHIAGREPDAGIWLESPKVSRRHALIVVNGRQAIIEDLGSKNGTFVGSIRISGPTALEAGDDIRIGPFTLIFRVAADAASTETEAMPKAPHPD